MKAPKLNKKKDRKKVYLLFFSLFLEKFVLAGIVKVKKVLTGIVKGQVRGEGFPSAGFASTLALKAPDLRDQKGCKVFVLRLYIF